MPLETLDPIGELAMAGVVRSTAYYLQDVDGVDVLPTACPGCDVHRRAAEKQYKAEMEAKRDVVVRREWTNLKCVETNRHGEPLCCRYLYGLADRKDERKRISPESLRQVCSHGGLKQIDTITLCALQRVNRPPGV